MTWQQGLKRMTRAEERIWPCMSVGYAALESAASAARLTSARFEESRPLAVNAIFGGEHRGRRRVASQNPLGRTFCNPWFDTALIAPP